MNTAQIMLEKAAAMNAALQLAKANMKAEADANIAKMLAQGKQDSQAEFECHVATLSA